MSTDRRHQRPPGRTSRRRVRAVIHSLATALAAGLLLMTPTTATAEGTVPHTTAAAAPELLLGQSTRGALDDFNTLPAAPTAAPSTTSSARATG